MSASTQFPSHVNTMPFGRTLKQEMTELATKALALQSWARVSVPVISHVQCLIRIIIAIAISGIPTHCPHCHDSHHLTLDVEPEPLSDCPECNPDQMPSGVSNESHCLSRERCPELEETGRTAGSDNDETISTIRFRNNSPIKKSSIRQCLMCTTTCVTRD
jgi:hypothetical protein